MGGTAKKARKGLTQGIKRKVGTLKQGARDIARGDFKAGAANLGSFALGAGSSPLGKISSLGKLFPLDSKSPTLQDAGGGALGLERNEDGAFVKPGNDSGPQAIIEEPGPEGETPAEAEQRRRRRIRANSLLTGRASTVSTNPLGLEAAQPGQRTLLGG